jgi:hypothetical protein
MIKIRLFVRIFWTGNGCIIKDPFYGSFYIEPDVLDHSWSGGVFVYPPRLSLGVLIVVLAADLNEALLNVLANYSHGALTTNAIYVFPDRHTILVLLKQVSALAAGPLWVRYLEEDSELLRVR